MPEPDRRRRNRWWDPLAGLVIAAAGLGLLELGSYALGSFPGPSDPLITPEEPQWANARVPDPLLFWRLRENVSGFGENPEDRGIPFSTNALGFRGPEVGRKEPGEFRVLSLGESSTFGAQVGAEETYSHLLQQALPRINEKNVSVINAGSHGYTIVQGFALLHFRGLDLDPDAVLLYFGYNDFLPVHYRRGKAMGADGPDDALNDWQLLQQRLEPSARLSAWLLEHSNLARGVLNLLRPSEVQPRRDPATSEVTETRRPRVPGPARRLMLERILELCAERGIHLTVIVPWYQGFRRHEPLLRSFATENQLTLVDLPRLLPRQPVGRFRPKDPRYFGDRIHPNARGHRLMAEHIAEIVEPEWTRFDRSGSTRDDSAASHSESDEHQTR